MSAHSVSVRPQDDLTPRHSLSASPTAPLFIWRCAVCLRREEFGMTELYRYAHVGWPVCCGQVVSAYPEANEPGPRAEG